MKKIVKGIGIFLAVIVVALMAYAGYLLLGFHRLPDNLALEIGKSGEPDSFNQGFEVEADTTYKIVTYNIGFGAYLPEFSFFMDGGKSSWAKDEESVLATVSASGEAVSAIEPDFIFLQEVDRDGTRSYHVDELEVLNRFIEGYEYHFAQNYDSPYLFFPPWEPHGTNVAGLVTYSKGQMKEAVRRSLPISESITKFMDLDRCYSISRIPTADESFLCLYNVHLAAYGSSAEVREGQLAMLYADMTADYEKGNYVICGGDFNHNVKSRLHENAPEWAHTFPRETLPDGFDMAINYALSEEDVAHDSCRSAEEPYQEGRTFTITLDGFIVSDNVNVTSYEHYDWGYGYSDHDPVVMEFELVRQE